MEDTIQPAGRWRWFLLVLVTIATLWAGLDPKGYRFRNEVEWLEGRAGLRFGKFGRVHTEPFIDQSMATALNRDGFTLRMTIDPAVVSHGGFRTIACFHSVDAGSQLVVGQWRDFVIVMNGDDYNNKRRWPRVTADVSMFAQRPLMLEVVSTPHGTGLFLNGELVETNSRLHLKLPATPDPGRLVLGNSVNASQPWTGEINFLELLARPLTADEIRARDQNARVSVQLVADPGARPWLRFRFDEPGGNTVRNHGALAATLSIPGPLHALGTRALAWAPESGLPGRALALDIALNFLGFLPFGAAVALVLMSTRRSSLRVIVVAVLSGMLLSLVIELTQAWLPSRDSSLRDLLLNTVGTPFGAAGVVLIRRWLRG